jgi:hypothetical protein
VALIEFTPRAAQGVREILENDVRLEEKLLVVEMFDQEAQLCVKTSAELVQLQSDVEMIGPFRIPIGDDEVSLFVREPEVHDGGPYELDYFAVGGRPSFQIKSRTVHEIVLEPRTN